MNYFVTCLLVFSACALYGQDPTYADLDYAGDGDERHLLDVYIPDDLETDRPCVMYIHGGSWSSGSKGNAMRLLEDLWLEHGFVVVDVNYRYTSDGPFPAQVHDNKTAVRYLKANAELFGIDTCRIGVVGKSAGGHLAALMALSQNELTLEGVQFGNTHVTSQVHAVVAFQGIYDFVELDASFLEFCDTTFYYDLPDSAVSKYLGCQFSECVDVAAAASPVSHIGNAEPPFAIFHGALDCTAPAPQSEMLYQSLVDAGNSASIKIFPDAEHSGVPEEELVGDLVAFFIQELGPAIDCIVVPSSTKRSSAPDILFDVVPNPASNVVTIWEGSGKVLQDVEIRIVSLSGQEHLRATNVLVPFEVEVSQLPIGYYIVQLKGDNFCAVQKLSVFR